jgi:hypothetical protein
MNRLKVNRMNQVKVNRAQVRLWAAGVLTAWLSLLLGACSPVLTDPAASPPPESAVSGQALIQVAASPARSLYPETPAFTGCTLSFVHEDGETAPEALLPAGESLVVDLKAGFWTISAAAWIDDPQGGDPFPVLQGSTRVEVEPGERISALISLDKTISGGDREGRLRYQVEYPPDRVSAVTLTVSAWGDTGTFYPVLQRDLREGVTEQETTAGTLSLPAGYYRVDIRAAAVYPFAGRTEAVHIYPGLETVLPPVVFSPEELPLTEAISGVAALAEYLESLPMNTEKTPYPVELTGVDLGSTEKKGDTLRTLYEALNRYVALDLRGCTGESIQTITKTNKIHKDMIAALILPESVATIKASGFLGYDTLVYAELPGVHTLEVRAFKGCAKLESVYMPALNIIEDASNAENGAFRDCAALEWVFLPQAHTIGDYAFYECKALTALDLPAVTTLGKLVFKKSEKLSAVFLPQVTAIGNQAFVDCPRLSFISLGAEVPALGGNPFSSGSPPREIRVPAAAVEAYQNTDLTNWTVLLKGLIKAVP